MDMGPNIEEYDGLFSLGIKANNVDFIAPPILQDL